MMITTSSIVVRTIVAVGGVLLLSSRVAAQTETVEYYGLDALGSVRVVFDASGNVTGRMDYGPFGESLVTGSGMPSRAYAGLFRDGEAGLDHAEARSYQSRTGRFASVDPVYAGLFEPQQWNRYAYGLNNPIQNSDSTGLLADSCTRSSSWIDEDGVRRITSNCPTEGGGGSGGGWISNDLYNNLLSFSWGIQDLLFITDTAAYFGGHGSGEPSAAGAAINVEAIAKGVLDAYGEPAELVINEVKNFDAQNTQCNSGTGVGQLGACLGVLAAVAPIPALKLNRANFLARNQVRVYLGLKDGQAAYVGITNNPLRRAAQHGDRFRIQTISDFLTRLEGRAIEQAMIIKNPQFENVINSISPRNPIYAAAVAWGEAWLKRHGY